MGTAKPEADWERIEQLYRAGVLSLREIAAACPGSNHVAITRRAKKHGWVQDLSAKIKAKAEDLVTRQAVTAHVTERCPVTDRGIIEANAIVIADIRIAHRTDIGRAIKIANLMFEELEVMTEERGLLRELLDQLIDEDEAPTAMLEMAQKMASLPSRSKTMKELAETLKNLIGLQRQAYDLGNESPKDRDKLSDDELDARIRQLQNA
jgi:hypothetical protein